MFQRRLTALSKEKDGKSRKLGKLGVGAAQFLSCRFGGGELELMHLLHAWPKPAGACPPCQVFALTKGGKQD